MSHEINDPVEDAGQVIQVTASCRQRVLPKLPPNWLWTTVGEVAEVFRGASPRPKGDPRYFGGSIPWIMISDVTRQPGKYLYGTKEGVTESGAALSRRLPLGSLILSNSGTICVPKILKVEGCIHDGFVAFNHLEDTVDVDFAYWWFECVRPRMVDENRQGMTQVNLNTDIVREMHFPLAPRKEQRRVVDEIEKQTTRLDAATAALKRVQANLKRYRASVLKAACEGRLVPTEAELARKEGRDYEPADKLLQRILREGGARWEGDTLAKMIASGKSPQDNRWKGKYQEPSAPDTSNLPNLPEGWCWTSLEQLIREPLRNGHSAVTSRTGQGVRTLTLSAVTEGDFSERNTKLTVADPNRVADLWLEPGDLLIERSNTPELVGTARVFRGASNYSIFPDLLIRVRLTEEVSDFYIEACLQTRGMRTYFQSSAQGISGTMPKIDQETIKKAVVPLPPRAEQLRICQELARIVTGIDHAEASIDLHITRGQKLRQSILSDAFAGKLFPQDPADEPASVLLERIRCERGVSIAGASRRTRMEVAHV